MTHGRDCLLGTLLGLMLLSPGCSRDEYRDISARDVAIMVTTRTAVFDEAPDSITCGDGCPELQVKAKELGNVAYSTVVLPTGCALRLPAPSAGDGEITVRVGLSPKVKKKIGAAGLGFPVVVISSICGAQDQVLARLELRQAVTDDPERGWYRVAASFNPGSFSLSGRQPPQLRLGIEPEPGMTRHPLVSLADLVVGVRQQQTLSLEEEPLLVRVPPRFQDLTPASESAGDLFQHWARARRCLSLLLGSEGDRELPAPAMLAIASELEESYQAFSKAHSARLFWQLWQAIPEEVAAGPPDLPDIVLVVLDAARRDHFSSYGYERLTTPSIDSRLAAHGVVFSHAYSTGTCTNASVPTMMTGQYSTFHLFSFGGMQLPSYVSTLAEQLRGHGYATLGVTSNPFLATGSGIERGFLSYDTLEHYYHPYPKAEDVVERAMAQLPLLRWTPVFLSLHLMDCHGPYLPPPPFDSVFDGLSDPPGDHRLNRQVMPPYAEKELFRLPMPQRREGIDLSRLTSLYDGGLHYADHHLGRLLTRLQQLALLDDTAVLVISDHGEELFEHGFSFHNYIAHEEKLRIPFIIKPPGSSDLPRGGNVEDRIDAIVDLLPTVLDLAGLPQPAGLHGRSLLPLVQPNPEPRPEEVLFYDNEWIHAVRRGPWKLIAATELREDRRSSPDYVLAGGLDDLLFNLEDDPGEQVNLVSREPEIADQLRRLLAARLAELRRQRRQARRDATLKPRSLDEESRRRLEALGYLVDVEPDADGDFAGEPIAETADDIDGDGVGDGVGDGEDYGDGDGNPIGNEQDGQGF